MSATAAPSKNNIEFDIQKIRLDFPILQRKINGKNLIYFDNAATVQKPQQVIDRITGYYSNENANVHRGIHTLSQEATTAFESTRGKVRAFINAKSEHEIIYTKGTTESINLVASSFGRAFVKPGEQVVLTMMEHHSNIVPWQILCEEKGAILKVVPITIDGDLIIEELEKILEQPTAVVAFTHVSNALGSVNPVKEIIKMAQRAGAVTVIDGAQAVPHMHVNVQDLDCDFYCFSAHKMYGPTGFGILYGKQELLEKMPPYMGGGEMIKTVTFENTTYNELPFKFEAGTPNISAGIAFGAAIDFINEIGFVNIQKQEHLVFHHAKKLLSEIPEVQFIGDSKTRSAVISFLLKGHHPYDVGVILDQMGIAIRTGHHCTQPLMDFYGIPGTCRASFAFYNTTEEVDAFIHAVKRAFKMLQ